MRICRVYVTEKYTMSEKSVRKKDIPRAFAYKILRELEMADLVNSERGNQGGYIISINLLIS